MKKRIFLTFFFVNYIFFMPFVLLNCSDADRAYALDVEASLSQSVDNSELAQCQTMEFLVADCVAVLQAEEDRVQANEAIVSAANLKLADFESCQSVVILEEAALDCEGAISSLISAYQVCQAEAISAPSGCTAVISAMSASISACDESDSDVTDDFCASLTL